MEEIMQNNANTTQSSRSATSQLQSVRAAIQKQRDYFSTGATLSYDFRLRQLKKLRELILANESQIIEALTRDLGKSKTEIYNTEIDYVIADLDFIAKNLKNWMSPQKFTAPFMLWPASSQVNSEPYGVSLIISPWNYPFQLMVSPLIGAIAAGNTAIIKPSEVTKNTEKLILDFINKNFPPEYLYVMTGGPEKAQEILKEQFDFIFFTGGTEVGKVVMRAAAEHLTPVCLELGGKSPCIIDQDVNLSVTAKRVTWGKFMNVGQTCVAPDFLLVHESVKPQLIAEIKKTIEEFYTSDPQKSESLGRIVSERHFDRLVKMIETAKTSDKQKILHGGRSDRSTRFIEPTLIELSPGGETAECMKEEIFGPVWPLITYKSLDEAILLIKKMTKPLALYVYTNNSDVSERVLKELSFGGGCVNDCNVHLASPHLPFGGVGSSGIGAYHGKHSFDLFSHKKSILKKSFAMDSSLRYPPYSDKKLSILRKLMKFS